MLRVEHASGSKKDDTGELEEVIREAEANILPPDARKITERRLGMLAQAASMVERIDDVLGNYDIHKQVAEAPRTPPPKHQETLELIDS
ncbi:MAG: hypothetical protein PVI21_03875 [Candidatus Woesebacteria bacterium]|jgi:hypothetical protein